MFAPLLSCATRNVRLLSRNGISSISKHTGIIDGTHMTGFINTERSRTNEPVANERIFFQTSGLRWICNDANVSKKTTVLLLHDDIAKGAC